MTTIVNTAVCTSLTGVWVSPNFSTKYMDVQAVIYSHSALLGLIMIFFAEGEILVCSSIPKLGILGVCSPRKKLKFTTSETVSGGF